MTNSAVGVSLVEVGPRDGLQNEAREVSTEDKVRLIECLIDAGLRRIEATSFVNPAVIPRLADAESVLSQVRRREGVELMALVPNERGMERALRAGVDRVALFTAATDRFCEANIRCTVDESFRRFAPVLAAAKSAGIPVRGYVSVAFDCPYTGQVSPEAAVAVGERLMAVGCDEVAIADTTGRATPAQVAGLLDVAGDRLPVECLALHLHDTYGNALDNIRVAYGAGVRTFDSAVGGLGGCPFAPGAAGNVATEAVVDLFAQVGVPTGVDPSRVVAAGRLARDLVGRAAA